MALEIWHIGPRYFLRLYCQRCSKLCVHIDAELPVAARAALKTYIPGLKDANETGKGLGLEFTGVSMICNDCVIEETKIRDAVASDQLKGGEKPNG